MASPPAAAAAAALVPPPPPLRSSCRSLERNKKKEKWKQVRKFALSHAQLFINMSTALFQAGGGFPTVFNFPTQ